MVDWWVDVYQVSLYHYIIWCVSRNTASQWQLKLQCPSVGDYDFHHKLFPNYMKGTEVLTLGTIGNCRYARHGGWFAHVQTAGYYAPQIRCYRWAVNCRPLRGALWLDELGAEASLEPSKPCVTWPDRHSLSVDAAQGKQTVLYGWDLICILARSLGFHGITFERSTFTKIASFKIKLVLLWSRSCRYLAA